jgi:hypothetical protein
VETVSVVSRDGVSGLLLIDSCGVGVVEGTDVAGGGLFGVVAAGGGFVGEAGGVYAIAFVEIE